jgi:tryptophanase
MKNLAPASISYVKRSLPVVTVEQRERALKMTEYNMFSFPGGMVTIDLLSDSGSSAMTDLQWASLFLGDECYGRNRGYYVLLDAIRDTFERGDEPKKIINLFRAGEDRNNVEKTMTEVYLAQEEGGFVNGGVAQLKRPNAFIVPQGRCAENILFSTLGEVFKETAPGKQLFIPSNGHFDTTQGNIRAIGVIPRNFFKNTILDVPEGGKYTKNPFKGDMDIEHLRAFIEEKGLDAIPMIYMTITNNSAGGQPVSMANIKAVSRIAKEYDVPFFIDACRFAENAYFIKMNEAGYQDKSIQAITKETFSYCDGFTISFKKDGLANMGGGLFFRDQGTFPRKFSVNGDIGIRIKEKQIGAYGNDSYGAMSGHDIFALASGLYEIVRFDYLDARIKQVEYFADGLYQKGLPVILPAGGHAVYLDMNRFFDGKRRPDEFASVGFSVELLRRYGIRGGDLGYFAFEWDKKPPEQQAEILDLFRFAIPRNVYNKEHFDYVIEASAELHKDRDHIPSMKIIRGAELRLRHFQSGLAPVTG